MKLLGEVPESLQFEYDTETGAVSLGEHVVCYADGASYRGSCKLALAARAFVKKCQDEAINVDGMSFYRTSDGIWQHGDMRVVEHSTSYHFVPRTNVTPNIAGQDT